jgi:hypothetical protein
LSNKVSMGHYWPSAGLLKRLLTVFAERGGHLLVLGLRLIAMPVKFTTRMAFDRVYLSVPLSGFQTLSIPQPPSKMAQS